MKIVESFREAPAVEVLSPSNQLIPFVFSSPHSGCCYPKSFLSATQLDTHHIRQSEDAYVDYLFSEVVDKGATLIRANFPRAFLDVNREPYELDPNMFDCNLPTYINSNSKRATGGIGTIPRIVGKSQEIYNQPLDLNEVLNRIENLYQPFHTILQNTLENIHDQFGYVVLFDCHSMPTIYPDNTKIFRPDFILGDRFGRTCSKNLIEITEEIFRSFGYSVGRNNPFAGGYITEKYGKPDLGYYSIQIELSRDLYLNGSDITLTPNAETVKSNLAIFAKQIAEKFIPDFLNYLIAAE